MGCLFSGTSILLCVGGKDNEDQLFSVVYFNREIDRDELEYF